MDHMKLSDELRQQLLESAAWGKAGIVLSEGTKKSKKDKKEEKEEGGDPKAFGGKKGDKSQTHKGEDDVCEEVSHVCPLCVSQLDEAIDEERILEHLNVVVGLVDRLSQLDEGDEDIDSIIDETISELLFQDMDAEEE